MTWQEAVLRGVVFGLGAAAPIGPVNVEIARRAMRHGSVHGIALGLGAVTIDVIYVLAAMAGVSVAARSPWVFWPLAVGGTLLLAWLGAGSLLAAKRAMRDGWGIDPGAEGLSQPPSPPLPLPTVYATGLAMTAVNPMTLAFWFGGYGSQALTQGGTGGVMAYLAAGVFVGTLAWVLGFSSLMAWLGRSRKAWWMAVADVVGGVVLLAFAATSAWVCVRRLLG